MAQTTTEWVLNFKDRISSGISSMVKKIQGAVKSVGKLNESWGLNEEETRKALKAERESLKQTQAEIKRVQDRIKGLKDHWSSLPNDPLHRVPVEKDIEKLEKKFQKLNERIINTKNNIKTLNKDLSNFGKTKTDWTMLYVKINQFSELVNKLSRGLDFSVEVRRLKDDVQRMTELTGDALYDFVKRSREIAAVYRQDASSVADSVNAMMRQLGGSYEDNFNLLEEGFKRGANLSGNLLNNMKDYAGAFAEMGISGRQAMVILAKAEKEGLNADDAIKGIKNAGDALAEMDVRRQKALASIGIGMEELRGKTVFEAIQTVSEAMDGMSEQAKQTVVAKVFGQAGKDSGVSFVQGLANEIPDLSTLPAVEESAAGFKRFFSNITTWAGDAFGGVSEYAQQLSPMIQIVAGGIPIMSAFGKMIKANTVATKLWTVATNIFGKTILGIPIIGWIIAIGTAIAWVVSKTEGWGNAWKHTVEGMKLLVSAFVEKVKAGFNSMVNGIMIAIDKIKLDWYRFKQAVGLGDSDENQAMIDKIQNDVKRRAEAIIESQVKANKKMMDAGAAFLAAGKSLKWKSKDDENELGVNNLLNGENAKRLSFSEDENGNAKGNAQSGLSISGRRGAANITMTINNYFNAAADVDIRSLADKVAGRINDVLQDAMVTI